jgi:hypothetical protein
MLNTLLSVMEALWLEAKPLVAQSTCLIYSLQLVNLLALKSSLLSLLSMEMELLLEDQTQMTVCCIKTHLLALLLLSLLLLLALLLSLSLGLI